MTSIFDCNIKGLRCELDPAVRTKSASESYSAEGSTILDNDKKPNVFFGAH